MKTNELPCFTDRRAKQKLIELCEKEEISAELIQDLCQLVHEYTGMERKNGLNAAIESAIDRLSEPRPPAGETNTGE